MDEKKKHFYFSDSLKIHDIRLFVGSLSFFTLGSRALAVVIGFQIYRITHSAMALGWLGLVEAIPAISLVLFGGYVADHYNRQPSFLLHERYPSVVPWRLYFYPGKHTPHHCLAFMELFF